MTIIRSWRLNDAPLVSTNFDTIIGNAAARETDADAANSPISLIELSERLDLLLADVGKWQSYKAASTEYIAEFTAEVRWHRRVRLGVCIACLCLVLFLAGSLVVGVLFATPLFGKDHSHALTALVVATISGSVVVIISAVRGAFSTLSDRNTGLPMPEHVKELYEVGRAMFGKTG